MPLADVNGTKLNYRLDGPGQGTVVMFSNSLASALSMWDLQIPPLVEAGYRCGMTAVATDSPKCLKAPTPLRC